MKFHTTMLIVFIAFMCGTITIMACFFSVEGITRPKNGDFNELRLEEATNKANNHLFRV
jgi:hypothetical protein